MVVDKNGFNQIGELIEKDRLRSAVRAKAIAFQNDTNTCHDNSAYDDALEKENGAIMEINRLIDIKNKIEIIHKHNDPTLIDIGGVITVEMNGDDVFDVILTGKYLANLKIWEITLNSPMGMLYIKRKLEMKLIFIHIITQNKK